MSRLAPVISISHGGGPMPLLEDPNDSKSQHHNLVKSLRTTVPKKLKIGTPEEPRAIVLVTAHWNTDVPMISSAEKHDLYYDYGGFPPEAYKVRYDAPGSPEVAGLVEKALKEAGLEPKKDLKRGWDHGVFVPMSIIHPAATIPIVQVSVLNSEDPATHFRYGQALSTLRAQNIAIIGSGFASLHNMRHFFSGISKTRDFQKLHKEWSNQVTDAVQTKDVEERRRKFEDWRHWTGAFDMHPRLGAEHFLPLIVCAGAGQEGKAQAWGDEFIGLHMWSYSWA